MLMNQAVKKDTKSKEDKLTGDTVFLTKARKGG
jgi:hypothetical protein